MRRSEGEGWHRGDDGMLHKKYDPHAATRAAQYEARLRAHQEAAAGRGGGGGGGGARRYASNEARTADQRGFEARAKAAEKREEKVARARRFNDRHEAAIKARHTSAAERQREEEEDHKAEDYVARRRAPPPKTSHSAAASHRENDAYMRDLRSVYGLDAPAPVRSSVAAGAGAALEGATRSRTSARRLSGQVRTADFRDRWRAGPLDPRGVLVDCSDRPLLALSASEEAGDDLVVAGSDHALYGVDAASTLKRRGATTKPTRTLYSKTQGHSDWVSCVAHLGPLVLSAGLDGRFCCWRGARCLQEVLQPSGTSLSVLLVDEAAPIALTAGYDGVAHVWKVPPSPSRSDPVRSVATLASPLFAAPVLCAAWAAGRCAIGDRQGRCTLYDAEAARALTTWAPRHNNAGHCVSVAACVGPAPIFAAGSADGHLRLWDAREPGTSRPQRDFAAHVQGAKAGAVGCLAPIDTASVGGAQGRVIASAGADGAVVVCDDRLDRPMLRFHEHRDFPYAIASLGEFVLTGAGDGSLLCHDLIAGDCCWGLGAGQNAIRAIEARPHQLAAAGDDGNLLVWEF